MNIVLSPLTAPLWLQSMGELVGTLLLVLLGNGVCFSVSHKKMFANQSGRWVLITFGWALAVFLGVFVASVMGAPGHINPAVSVYASINSKSFEPLAFIPMQLIGAMLGQSLLYLMNWNFIKEEMNNGENLFVTRGASCTNPAYDGKKAFASNFLYEFIGTSLLLLIVMLTSSEKLVTTSNSVNMFVISAIILSIGISLGSATGFAINPARDLGPRITYQILRLITKNKIGHANWSYSWIPVLAPIAAGIIFGSISLVFI